MLLENNSKPLEEYGDQAIEADYKFKYAASIVMTDIQMYDSQSSFEIMDAMVV